jgi:hypothetical protein
VPDDLAALALPTSLSALLGARLDSLDSRVRATLERGSVEGEVFHVRRFRIEFIGECLEPPGGLLDLGVCVLHVITSSSQEPVKLGPQR